MDTYYFDQLEKLKQDKNVIHVKFQNNISTNWLSLNEESAKIIIEFLTTNYINNNGK